MQNITIPYNEETLALAREIIRDVRPYTPEQLAEIPAILATKARYFWANDLNDWEVFKDVYTDEAPEGFRVSMGAGEKRLTPDEQVGLNQWSIGPQENMVPMHFGHNQIVQFIDDTHAVGTCYAIATLVTDDGGKDKLTMHAVRYHDKYVKVDGRWWIAEREQRFVYSSVPPLV